MHKNDNTTSNINISDTKTRNKIIIDIGYNIFYCSFMAKYRIFNIDNDETIHIIMSETLFNIDDDDDICLIVYTKN